ncbi:hypothetical protein [Streptosporangium vulgare]|uniref:DUF397 domain-containing protein n=1 Tax=Streptosporangium vulgare TaxID=46190 RepID=A0ABV5TE39_9ACTN
MPSPGVRPIRPRTAAEDAGDARPGRCDRAGGPGGRKEIVAFVAFPPGDETGFVAGPRSRSTAG